MTNKAKDAQAEPISLETLDHLLAEAGCEETMPVTGQLSERSFRSLKLIRDGVGEPVDFLNVRDGAALAYRRYGEDSDRIVVLVHGSAGHGGHFRMLAGAIAARAAVTVYAFDMRGHGRSGRRRGHSVTYPEQMADDLEDIIGFLHAARPRARIVLAGFSAGGGLVLRFSVRPCARALAGYFFLAPYLGLESPATRLGFGGWISVYGRRLQAIIELNGHGIAALNHLPVLEFNQPPSTCDGTETLSWSFATMLAFGPRDGHAHLSAIPTEQPVLVVAGTADECMVGEAYPQVLASTAVHARVELIPDIGHWDLLTTKEVEDGIVSWLSELAERRS